MVRDNYTQSEILTLEERLEPSGLESPGLESPGLESPGLESPGLESSGLESSGLESPELEFLRLESFNSAELCDLVHDLLSKKPELYQLILEWLKEKQKAMPKTTTNSNLLCLNDRLLFEYWEGARTIISEFNELGGGPEAYEEAAYGYLNEISELIREGYLSTAAKLEFLDEAFEEYDIGHSGFEDELADIFFEICQTKEEWEYLVKKLDAHPSNWRKKLIMEIQRIHLQDDEAYLEERMKILHNGMDYWDLVNFYTEKGDLQKALETAETGILEGEGRVTELFEFLWDHFSRIRYTPSLERIVNTALSRQTEEKNMLDRLFEHYRSKGSYEGAKDALLRSFEFTARQYYTEYRRLKGFLKEPDWESIEPEILNKIKEKDFYDYLRICMDKDMKETVLKSILNPPENRSGFLPEDGFDGFANKLAYDFPEEIIEYYWKKAYQNISDGNRKKYRDAARYLGKAKSIYLEALKDSSGWTKRFSGLKSEFKKRPAFLEEVGEL